MSSHINGVLDLGALESRTGYFLLTDAPQQPFIGTGGGDRAPWRFCSTYRESPKTLRSAVLELIRSARRKIFVTSFIIGDDEVLNALTDAARRLTGGVYVISELSDRSLRQGLAELAEREQQGKKFGPDVETAKKRFEVLTRNGVAVRGHENCHAKFVVVDDSVAWVGSANLDTRALTVVGEVGVTTTDHAEVDRLARLFATMWKAGCNREMPNTPGDYVARRRTADEVTFTVPAPPPEPDAAIIWTRAEDHILRGIHATIDEAQDSLLLASFSLTGLRASPELLLKPLESAIARGVTVDLIVRARNNRDDHVMDARALHDLGVRLVADDLNHAKAVVADDRTGLLFSANFDATHGLEPGSGIEVGARLNGTTALPELVRYLRHAITHATHKFVAAPTARQLDQTLTAKWKAPWPLADELAIRCTSNDWHLLEGEMDRGPVLWESTDPRDLQLLASRSKFAITPESPGICRLLHLGNTEHDLQADLRRWWRQPSTKISRGYCPARLRRLGG
ncbi:phosphatidylserine/phosphatidylglycerophosphate/cardiolipin synthase family protein [Amycolatopsis sp. Hca4]|uniref:phospholipase D-like domain-containing protein n=1 Tax=Amycolatopsis sp. Hca4 TaxID=2742131 RepID=UPI00159284E4|nr:phosphatidylserine/phosphatidylglycerophosphate/cardiolipin synthase family protein [Amycolatopsis sp. Hca4]QKV78170.1 phosphatidylserine/phosphatidylglycerophosphate/cardiolipin synthase family protein [Amycolatopsis sp. Hca4]